MDRLAQRIEQLTPLQKAAMALKETRARLDALERARSEPIAIVGMACRFPGGADGPGTFWQMLCDGVDAIGQVPPERWNAGELYDPDPEAPGKMNTRWGGFLQRIDEFDNEFFGIGQQEAIYLDPQQRLLLELGWEALEDAGIPPERLKGSSSGVFVGMSRSDYGGILRTLGETDPTAATGCDLCIAANRLSFALDFLGPSMTINTACSSALVAAHLACDSLRRGESPLALVAGVNVILSPHPSIQATKAGLSAPDGRCRSFDAQARGYVRSEGAGVVVLKTLGNATADGDPIYAVIRASAVGQYGRSSGLTVPSRRAQETVIRNAYARANVSPGAVQFVETQGTATALGDTVEALALGTVLATDRPPGSTCALGAVKTNIGHTESASGIASLIKVALALGHRRLPPNLHYHTPHPDIPFDRLPLRMQQELAPWPDGPRPALAGVSAFGFGGTLAHVVLEEAPPAKTAPPTGETPSSETAVLIPASARSQDALRALAAAYADFLADESVRLEDFAFTAAVRREHHDHRLAITARSRVEAIELLEAFVRGESRDGLATGRKPLERPPKLNLPAAERHGRLCEKPAGDKTLVSVASGDEPQDTAPVRPTYELLAALGRLYAEGHEIDFRCLHSAERTCLRLPTYPWQRKRLWIESQPDRARRESPDPADASTEGLLRQRPNLKAPYAPPRDDMERRMARAWASVLKLDRVGLDDNFIELGGNSLQAGMLINRLQERLGVDVSPTAMFEAQTIRDLADYLRREFPAAVARMSREAPPERIPVLAREDAAEALPTRVDDLSDDDVDSLLAELLADREDINE